MIEKEKDFEKTGVRVYHSLNIQSRGHKQALHIVLHRCQGGEPHHKQQKYHHVV